MSDTIIIEIEPAAGESAALLEIDAGLEPEMELIEIQFGADGAPGANSTVPGPAGADGEDGREIELRTNSTHVQWRYVGDPSWINLIALSAITGAAGANGTNGTNGINGINGTNGINGINGTDGADGREIELRTNSTHVQWRYAGESWTNLIALSAITGPAGANGTAGIGLPLGNFSDATIAVFMGGEWTVLEPPANQTGNASLTLNIDALTIAWVGGNESGSTPTALMHYDASVEASLRDAGNAQAADGEEVDQWLDQSGSARHLAASDSAPILAAAGLNGQPAVAFASPNHFVFTQMEEPEEWTMFVVFLKEKGGIASIDESQNISLISGDGITPFFGNLGWDESISVASANGQIWSWGDAFQAGRHGLLTVKFAAGQAHVWLDNVDLGAGTYSEYASGTTIKYLGVRGPEASHYSTTKSARLGEVRLVGEALANGTISTLNAGLITKWGLATQPSDAITLGPLQVDATTADADAGTEETWYLYEGVPLGSLVVPCSDSALTTVSAEGFRKGQDGLVYQVHPNGVLYQVTP